MHSRELHFRADNLWRLDLLLGSEEIGALAELWAVPSRIFGDDHTLGFAVGVYEEQFKATLVYNRIYDPPFPFVGLHRWGFILGATRL